jgi:hypothetical protein
MDEMRRPTVSFLIFLATQAAQSALGRSLAEFFNQDADPTSPAGLLGNGT